VALRKQQVRKLPICKINYVLRITTIKNLDERDWSEMQPNRRITEEADEMAKPLSKNGCRTIDKENTEHQGRRRLGMSQLRWEDCVEKNTRRL